MRVKIQILAILLMVMPSTGSVQANEINLQDQLAGKNLSQRLDVLDAACSEVAEYHAGKKSVKNGGTRAFQLENTCHSLRSSIANEMAKSDFEKLLNACYEEAQYLEPKRQAIPNENSYIVTNSRKTEYTKHINEICDAYKETPNIDFSEKQKIVPPKDEILNVEP